MVDNMHCCTVCGTVNQSMGTLLHQEETFNLSFNPTQRTIMVKRKSAQANISKGSKTGRPWKSDEGFQFIIMQQVEALIALGAAPELKEVALKIWAKYLRQSGRSFCRPQHKHTNKLVPFLTLRDQYIGTMDDARVRRVGYFISSNTTWYKKRLLDMDDDLDDGGMFDEDDDDENDGGANEDDDDDDAFNTPYNNNSITDGSENYKTPGKCKSNRINKNSIKKEKSDHTPSNHGNKTNDDNNDNSDGYVSDISSLRDKKKPSNPTMSMRDRKRRESLFGSEKHIESLEEDSERWLFRMVGMAANKRKKEEEEFKEVVVYDADRRMMIKKKKPALKDMVGKMGLIKCLTITYLALQATNPHVLVHDLIRLVIQGSVPYQRFPNWPQDMHLFTSDYQLFSSYSTPSVHEVISNSHKICRYASLDCFKRVDIRLTIARFILELSLPSDLSNVTSQLFQMYEPNLRLRSTIEPPVQPAVVAMAYICMALKLLFVLDDATEIQISEAVEKLQRHVHFKKPLFSWAAWVVHCEKKFCRQRVLYGVKNMSDMPLVERMGQVLVKEKGDDEYDGSVVRFLKLYDNSKKDNHYKPCKSSASNWYKNRLLKLNAQRSALLKIKELIDNGDDDEEDDISDGSDDGEDGYGRNRRKRNRKKKQINEEEEERSANHQVATPTYSPSSCTHTTLSYLFDPVSFTSKFPSLSKFECPRYSHKDHLLSSSHRPINDIVSDFHSDLNIDSLPWQRYMMQVDRPSHHRTIKKYCLPIVDFDNARCENNNKKKKKRMGRSMEWLLDRCCSYVNCSPEQLKGWMRCLEDIYFKDVIQSSIDKHNKFRQHYNSFRLKNMTNGLKRKNEDNEVENCKKDKKDKKDKENTLSASLTSKLTKKEISREFVEASADDYYDNDNDNGYDSHCFSQPNNQSRQDTNNRNKQNNKSNNNNKESISDTTKAKENNRNNKNGYKDDEHDESCDNMDGMLECQSTPSQDMFLNT